MDRNPPMSGRGNATYLGFDFGERNIGVAVGQRVTGTATALLTIRVTRPESVWIAVSQLVRTWQPTAFVVGMPYHPDGEENPIVQPILHFCRQLEERYQCPVYMMDETLSTKESQEIFYRERSKRSSKFVDIKDELAAQLILQTWLKHTTPPERSDA